MRIAHIATIDIGGAYKAVCRIQKATEKSEVQNSILLRTKTFSDTNGRAVLNSVFQRLKSKVFNLVNLLFFTHSTIVGDKLGTDIYTDESIKLSDVIVIHWVNSFLTPTNIAKLASLGKPVIVMLHDMWHFTGGCHYDHYCKGYQIGCVNCPQLSGKFAGFAARNLEDKARLYENRNVFIVAPGKWVAEEARKSIPMKNSFIKVIPNCLNTDVYKPMAAEKAAKRLGISKSSPIVMFIAMSSGKKNKTKGLDYLTEALKYLDSEEITLLVVGDVNQKDFELVSQRKIFLGYLKNEEDIVAAYNISDVTVVASLQETFSFATCESMACGTPVVAFPIGGVSDQVRHCENGYLAEYGKSENLAAGIRYCIHSGDMMRQKARQGALNYSYEAISPMWIEMYEHCIHQTAGERF